MKVYKFRSVDAYSLTGLANSEIWFSGLKDFNDPFEGSYQFDEDEFSDKDKDYVNRNNTWKDYTGVAQKNINEYLSANNIKDFDTWTVAEKEILVLKIDFESVIKIVHASKAVCLSRQYENESDFNSGKEKDTILENLLWSHYSSGLRGFCLAFDIIPFLESLNNFGGNTVLSPIKYQQSPERLEVKKWQELRGTKKQNYTEQVGYIFKSIATKSVHWNYEKEMRFLSLSQLESKRKYTPSSLIEIIIGEKMPLDQQKLVINTATAANPNVKVKLAKLKTNSYELEIVDYSI